MQNNDYGAMIYIVEKYKNNKCDIISSFDCCNINYICDFESLFCNPVNFNINIKSDKALYYANLKDVLHFLKEVIKEREKYFGKGNIWRRLKPLYKLIKSFNNNRWNNMIIVYKRYLYNDNL